MGKLIKISDYLKNKQKEDYLTDEEVEEILLETFGELYPNDEIKKLYEIYLKNKGDEKNV